MIELGLLSVSCAFAAKLAGIILGSVIVISVLGVVILEYGCRKWGFEFLASLIQLGIMVFWILMVFGVLFGLILLIGLLF